jgi:uncharacterized OB-fold protein
MEKYLEFLGYRCEDCKFAVLEPIQSCPECGSQHLTTFSPSQNGKIYTYTVVYIGFGHMASRAPYVLAIIEMPDSLKLTAVLEDVLDFEQVVIGLDVSLKRVDETIGPIFSFSSK